MMLVKEQIKNQINSKIRSGKEYHYQIPYLNAFTGKENITKQSC